MRFARLFRRQSPNSSWNCEVGYIASRIKKALGCFLSWLGFPSAASLLPDKAQPRVHQSELLSSDERTCKRLISEGETDFDPIRTGTLEVPVQPMEVLNPGSEEDGGERALLVIPAHVVDDAKEQDPMRNTPQMGSFKSASEEHLKNDEKTDPPAERDISARMVGAEGSSPHDVATHEAFMPRTAPDGGMSSVNKNEDDSEDLENAGEVEIEVDNRSVKMDTSAANAGVESASPNPAGIPNKNQPGRGSSLGKHRNTSTGAGISDPRVLNRLQAEGESKETIEGDCPATMKDSKGSSPRQPRPPEDAREYRVRIEDISLADREYARWNNAIVEQLLLAGPSSEEALLCVTPRILARVYEEAGLGSITPEHAEQQFTTAVSNLYQRYVLKQSARLRVLRRCSADGSPDCTAFLAGSVLAAFRMQSDEKLSRNAYYRRLADLLKCEMHGAHPLGLSPPVFESLWVFLENWLRKARGRQLAMPKGDIGFRRFVALPLAHVPLRSLDIEKLPRFFSWAEYQPGTRVRHDRLLSALKRWQQSRNLLTPIGTTALYDDRSTAVAAQVSAELEAWDGSYCESASRRSALVEIQLYFFQRSPSFFYLPRRPPGFPKVFEDGKRVFEASDEGWYDPAKLRPEDGELLESGFEWLSHARGIDFTLRRSGALAIPFTQSSSYSGFLSSRRLLRGVGCSVLCRDKIVPTVKDYLSEVAQRFLSPVQHPLLPDGWSMFRDVSARLHVEAPAGLEALEVDPKIDLIVAGGLRLGRSWSWLMGAAPQIMVSGMEAQDRIRVNGASVRVNASGELLSEGVFAEPGEYLIEAGSRRRRIKIERPLVSVPTQTEHHEQLDFDHRRRIALPHGSWTLIGNSPDQVCYSEIKFFRGTIASCPFHPSWAIQVGAGPGAMVAIASHPRPPRIFKLQRQTMQTRKRIEQWSSIIYAAHIRRPRFVWLNGAVPDESIDHVWKNYAALAKKIKRQLKK